MYIVLVYTRRGTLPPNYTPWIEKVVGLFRTTKEAQTWIDEELDHNDAAIERLYNHGLNVYTPADLTIDYTLITNPRDK